MPRRVGGWHALPACRFWASQLPIQYVTTKYTRRQLAYLLRVWIDHSDLVLTTWRRRPGGANTMGPAAPAIMARDS